MFTRGYSRECNNLFSRFAHTDVREYFRGMRDHGANA